MHVPSRVKNSIKRNIGSLTERRDPTAAILSVAIFPINFSEWSIPPSLTMSLIIILKYPKKSLHGFGGNIKLCRAADMDMLLPSPQRKKPEDCVFKIPRLKVPVDLHVLLSESAIKFKSCAASTLHPKMTIF